eukprot:CAMPEP_0198712822 /NCGR_PEP_ID=MMETSP1471-20131121/4501_1 /TAXON_ID=41880 /ORGANISM="Pycnococcus provasolii, Strain RCC733" /LENGTH=192 /DNA_ID=CAMNT_0044472821 /DNA_START=31 /DNA_END=609 /DNA_ORIENTATION=+
MPLVACSMSSCRTSMSACLTPCGALARVRTQLSPLKFRVRQSRVGGTRVRGLVAASSSSSSGGSSGVQGDELEKRPIAEPAILKNLGDVFVLDVRDNDEMDMGGEKLSSSVNVPLNKAKGVNKTLDEFKADLEAAGVWATLEQRGTDAPIITHCGAGGRGGKACDAMTKLGFTNVHNGGGPDDVRAVRPDLS